jgi:hypothetical protein
MIGRLEVLEQRGHFGRIAVPDRMELLLGKAAGDLRRRRVHRERAGMRHRPGDTEVIARHSFVPFLRRLCENRLLRHAKRHALDVSPE